MTQWVDIQYRDFWDVPRVFVAQFAGRTYLFEDPFDEEAEDYTQEYQVYELPPVDADSLQGSWVGLTHGAVRILGKVKVEAITFDSSKRRSMDSALIENLLKSTSFR